MKQNSSVFSVPSSYRSTCFSSPNSLILGYVDSVLEQGLRMPPGALQTISQTCRDVLFLCCVNSCRASEVLAVTTADYLGCGRYLCRGRKRSKSFSIYTGNPPVFYFRGGAGSPPVPLFNISYSQLYRSCRRAGIGFLPTGHHNVARTHQHRYLTASAVANVAGEAAVTDVLHHNSSRSRGYYIGKAG